MNSETNSYIHIVETLALYIYPYILELLQIPVPPYGIPSLLPFILLDPIKYL